MKPYILPLLLSVVGCETEEQVPTKEPVEAAQVTEPRVSPVPDLQNPALRELYPEVPDYQVFVRDLNPRERREAEEVIQRARFLIPYAVQLTNDSKLATSQVQLGGQELTDLYGGFLDQAEQALQDGSFLIEPDLADTDAYGKYHPLITTDPSTEEVLDKRATFTFRESVEEWSASIVLHEIAHDHFPSQHGTSPLLPEEKGRHIMDTNDQVYGVSETFQVLEAPIIYVKNTIHGAREDKINPQKAVSDLLIVKQASDDDWTRIFIEALENSFSGFLPEVGMTRDELIVIFSDPQFREYMRQAMNREIDEFVAEVNMSEAELKELQTRYQIDTTSDEFWRSMFISVTWRYLDGRVDPKSEAENELRKREFFKRIDRVNTAVRRTRDWR